MLNAYSERAEARGTFVDADGERWYRIDGLERMAPFLTALSCDSDLWAYISTAGSLAAGRRDQERSFFPYQTVDKIHARWESTGPRTWVLIERASGWELWEPFARRLGVGGGRRSAAKNLTGTRLALEEAHPDGGLSFRCQWSSNGRLGLIRKATIERGPGYPCVRVLDGLLNILPAGISNKTWDTMSYLVDAYSWNEGLAGGRLGVFSMQALPWDKAEPKECLAANVAWRTGPEGAISLLSDAQVEAFCAGREVAQESLTRGRKGAFLVAFEVDDEPAVSWYQVVDGPLSQSRVADLSARLERGWGTAAEIEEAIAENGRGILELLQKADGIQSTCQEMNGAHHSANVLYNIMRGGVFMDGTAWEKKALLSYAAARNKKLAPRLEEALSRLPERTSRGEVLSAVAGGDPQVERLAREFMPLTFSRRHGDPSRPWNKFSILVRDETGKRVVGYQGNWRDIFQNWEALAWSEPEYVDSMIATFLSAMTPDGYNPYRIGSEGIDWEVLDPEDPWSFIGYWGDHQVIYLQKLLECAVAFDPGSLAESWAKPRFSFADLPYRLSCYRDTVARPKATVEFSRSAHERALARAEALGADGKLVPDAAGDPVLGSLAEKLVAIILSKGCNIVLGGGIWLNTQRPEWNDANNAIVGNGLSVVSLAALRRFLAFLRALPCAHEGFDLPAGTARALRALASLAGRTPLEAASDPAARLAWQDDAGAILDDWRDELYRGWSVRVMAQVEPGLLVSLLDSLLSLVDASLKCNRRPDGLYHSYNLMRRSGSGIHIDRLYLMLEGQVSILSSGLLSTAEAAELGAALEASELYDSERGSYLLYPDRKLPGFLEKNVLDDEARRLPAIARLIADGRLDIIEAQADGTLRFAPQLANRSDVEAALGTGDMDRASVLSVADCYERIMGHRHYTGRSGAMFGFEGLGCIYWHMVAKLFLAFQEAAFVASDRGSPLAGELAAIYRKIRAGLGYKKRPFEFGAFPFDPYSHSPKGREAQQPGMTGSVKEEILARWGELGLRWKDGLLRLDPLLLDPDELPPGGALEFTFRRVPFRYYRAQIAFARVLYRDGWKECGSLPIDLAGAVRVEAGFDL